MVEGSLSYVLILGTRFGRRCVYMDLLTEVCYLGLKLDLAGQTGSRKVNLLVNNY